MNGSQMPCEQPKIGGFMQDNESGLTLAELIITLAVVAIAGSLFATNFMNQSERNQLRSDIRSIQVIQSAVDLYNLEQSENRQLTENGFIKALIDRLFARY